MLLTTFFLDFEWHDRIQVRCAKLKVEWRAFKDAIELDLESKLGMKFRSLPKILKTFKELRFIIFQIKAIKENKE